MKIFVSNLDVQATIDALLAGVEEQNMRLVTHINGQANAAKAGQAVPADQILEIFRPDFAIKVWNACKPAGHDIPLRIHIYEKGDQVRVACRMPSSVFAPFKSTALTPIGEELDVIFSAILAKVPEA